MAREEMSPKHERIVQFLKNNVRPIDIIELGTEESSKVMLMYRTQGYWLSEMYQYMPEIRPDLESCINQLKANGVI